MPTINRYVDEQGYYIRARPSDAGNITYKIKDECAPIVWKHGLRDGGEIAWSTIQAFKALGIIYTEQSGTLSPDDFAPDPEQIKETELTESDAQELFSMITTQFELSGEERVEIREILGLPPELDVEAIGKRVKSRLEAYVDTEGLTVRADLTIGSSKDIEITTWVEKGDLTENEVWNLHLLILSEDNEQSYFTDHCIHLCNEHGLERWHIRVLESPSWDIKRVAIEQRSAILPLLLDELRDVGFDLGDPAKVLPPLVDFTNSESTE